MVEGGWRDVCSGVLLAEMGAPKSRLMKVKEESEKGEKEGKGKSRFWTRYICDNSTH